MTAQEWEKKYYHLIERVRRMRGWQREYNIYRGSAEKETKKRMEREIDNLISVETKILKSKQKELF